MDTIKPTKKNVLVELDKLPDKTASGFHIARVTKDTRGGGMREYTSSPTWYGIVKAIGPDVKELSLGQHITFLQANCWEFGDTYVLIGEDSVMAVV